MQGDQVRVSQNHLLLRSGIEGKVEEILSHAYERIVGRLLGSEAKNMIGELRISDKKAMNFKVLVMVTV